MGGEGEGVSGRFEIPPRGPYSLAASARFLKGFAPAAYDGGGVGQLRLAFVADGGDEVAGVYVHEEDGVVVGEVYGGADVGWFAARSHASSRSTRMGAVFRGWGSGIRSWGGCRCVIRGSGRCASTPYEAAAWAIIGNRIRIAQAARVKASMARELGPVMKVRGKGLHAFPGP